MVIIKITKHKCRSTSSKKLLSTRSCRTIDNTVENRRRCFFSFATTASRRIHEFRIRTWTRVNVAIAIDHWIVALAWFQTFYLRRHVNDVSSRVLKSNFSNTFQKHNGNNYRFYQALAFRALTRISYSIIIGLPDKWIIPTFFFPDFTLDDLTILNVVKKAFEVQTNVFLTFLLQ